MSKNGPFLEPDDCLVDKPDSECGDKTGNIFYSSPDYTCGVCRGILHTETDIEGDTDSDFQPGERDEADSDEEGDDSDGAPVNPLDKDDTPEEAMIRNTQNQLREIIEALEEGSVNTDVYTSFFINNFEEIVSFYMLFTKYGPFQIFDRPSVKKEVIIETASAYMMMESKPQIIRFKILAAVTHLSEQGLISAALEFIRIYKGEDYRRGAYLIEIYASNLKAPDNFVKPMQEVWMEIPHPRGAIRDRVVAYIGAYLKHAKIKVTQQELVDATGATRTTLSPKIKEYYSILEEYRKR